MKVLSVEGSPHRGNTYDRVQRFGEVLEALGGVDFEHLSLRDIDLQPCRGCFICFDRGEHVCPVKDDKEELSRKLDEADGVVFATPVYSMHISYLMKRFVDRFAYTFHRPRYFGKYAVGMGVTGGIGLNEALEYVQMFATTWGFEYLGDLRYVDPPRNTKMPRFVNETDRAEELASKLHRMMREKPKRKLRSKDYYHFYMMRMVYKRLGPLSPTDFAYWEKQGWFDPKATYFSPDVRGSLLSSLFPRMLSRIAGWGLDRRMRKLSVSGAGEESGTEGG
jgi:multimeric flavodoxin WrbA